MTDTKLTFEEEHTAMCEQIHDLLTQAEGLNAYPTQAKLIAALFEAEEAAHEMCRKR